MLSTLIVAAALTLQGQSCPGGMCATPQMQITTQRSVIVEVPAQQYNIQVQPVQPQPRYYQVYPQPQIQIRYYQPLRPGDIVINQRIGLFGWRKEARIYRKLR